MKATKIKVMAYNEQMRELIIDNFFNDLVVINTFLLKIQSNLLYLHPN